jgi:hypothetical protein
MATIEDAIAAIKSGNRAEGREIIAELLKADRNNEQAWLWLTQTDITLEQKIKSLQHVLKINPDNEIAKEGLQKLQARQPKPKLESKPKSGLLKATGPPIKEAQSQDTKTCPYCAETIKAEAKICRFCGRNLTDSVAVDSSSHQLIDNYIAKKSRDGWQVVSRTDTSAQLRRPKQWSKVGLILGFVTLLFYGFGILILLFVAINYALQKEEVIYVTVDDLRIRQSTKQAASSDTRQRVFAAIALFIFVAAIIYMCQAINDGSRLSNPSTDSPVNPSEIIYYVWVSGFEKCPTHQEYGEQVTDRANTWTADGNARFIYIPLWYTSRCLG